MPSGLVAADVDPVATATKTPFPKAIELQFAEDGSVLAVHVMPSGLVAAAVDGPVATATKTPFPKATEDHAAEAGMVLAVAAYAVTGVVISAARVG